jgi:hypothetical protein
MLGIVVGVGQGRQGLNTRHLIEVVIGAGPCRKGQNTHVKWGTTSRLKDAEYSRHHPAILDSRALWPS